MALREVAVYKGLLRLQGYLLAFSSILITQIPAVSKTFGLYSKTHPSWESSGYCGVRPELWAIQGVRNQDHSGNQHGDHLVWR